MTKRWYVVQCKPNQEEIAVKHLKNQHFSIFYPTYRNKIKNKRGVEVDKVYALFPCYLFIELDTATTVRWRSINGTKGVVGLIGFCEDYISPLPVGWVEDLMKTVDNSGFIQISAAVRNIMKYSKGQQLEIGNGNFAGHTGTLYKQENGMVTLLLTLLNVKIKLILPIESVHPIQVNCGSISSNQE